MSTRDSIYSEPLETISGFTFDDKVAAVFPDMIKRSVPGYSSVIAMTGVLASLYAQSNTDCYDLGCSLGESTFAMRSQIAVNDCSIIAVDNSQQMLDQCMKNLTLSTGEATVDFICDDILNISLNKSSVVVLNYTLQFISYEKRDELLNNIYQSLEPGGILLLSEKIEYTDKKLNERMISMHHEFKKANGYSDLEISQKRSALENVLLPETIDAHQNRLNKSGFSKIDIWFQCFNFVSLIAYK